MSNWVDTKEIQETLVNRGWKSPDTYTNTFGVVGNFPAIYLFLLLRKEDYNSGFVAYVGMSTQLETRFSGHEVYGEINQPDFFPMRWFMPVSAHMLRTIEKSYIEEFDPPWNTIGRKRGVSLQ